MSGQTKRSTACPPDLEVDIGRETYTVLEKKKKRRNPTAKEAPSIVFERGRERKISWKRLRPKEYLQSLSAPHDAHAPVWCASHLDNSRVRDPQPAAVFNHVVYALV